jgi:hypothetical protein
MSYNEVAEKFRGCAEFANWDKTRTEEIVDLVRDLENLESIRTLTKLLAS